MSTTTPSRPSSIESLRLSWASLTDEEKAHGLARAKDYLGGLPSLADWAHARRVIDGRPFDLRDHRYLAAIYEDASPYVVIRKAAQMGASEYAISRALHFAVTKGGRTIYYFPTDNDVGEFSRDRFGPAINRSEYLSGLVKDTLVLDIPDEATARRIEAALKAGAYRVLSVEAKPMRRNPLQTAALPG